MIFCLTLIAIFTLIGLAAACDKIKRLEERVEKLEGNNNG